MSKQITYQLISGVFNSSEAKSIILSFFNHKILYHNNQLLRAMESNEGKISLIEQKIKELHLTSEAISKLLVEEIDTEHQVEVKGFIEINLKPLRHV